MLPIADGKPFLLALSGGRDSVALFMALTSCEIPFTAVHCNFHLRGDESDRDMCFAEDLCSQHGVDLKLFHFDTIKYAEEKRLSVEMACRELRYDKFREVKASISSPRILTAHHADDNIETLLLNLFRGAGVSGLRGILPDNGEIARPLLSISRKEIDEYLAYLEAPFIDDSSNFSSDYRRNFIRNEIIPLIESRWEGVRQAITHTISNLRSVESFTDLALREHLDPDFISYEKLIEGDASRLMLHHFLKPLAVSKSIEEEIFIFANSGSLIPGKQWIGKEGIAYSTRRGIEICRNEDAILSSGEKIDSRKGVPEDFEVEKIPFTHEALAEMKRERDNSLLYLPSHPRNYIFRHYRNGDRIRPLGMRGSRLVSDIFSDSKLSLREKQDRWIVENPLTNKIIWIEGLKRSGTDLLTPQSKFIYKIYRRKL